MVKLLLALAVVVYMGWVWWLHHRKPRTEQYTPRWRENYKVMRLRERRRRSAESDRTL